MVGGCNTDVLFDGLVLHVQTENRGPGHPIIETLVYCGGQILHQERSSTADLVERTGSDEEIEARLDFQHRDLVRRTRHGEFLPPHRGRLSAVFNGPSDLGALLLEQLAAAGEGDDPAFQPLQLEFHPSGAPGTLAGKVVVRRPEGAVVIGAKVRARLVGQGLPPAPVWAGATGPDGGSEVAAAIPPGIGSGVVFEAESEGWEGRGRFDLGSPVTADGPVPAGSRAPGSAS